MFGHATAFSCARKLTESQLNLAHGIKNETSKEETKNKNRETQKKRPE